MPVEDAKDLTQQFFEHLLEGHLLSRYDPRQGRFRHFLKGALRLFLAEARRDRRRQKRGGGKVIVSIALEGIEESHGDSPEEAFDRQWTQDVLANSLMRLRRRLVEEGKELYFRAYELYELAPERSTYESVGAKLGLSAGDVRNYLSCVRARLRELVIETVAGYAGSPEEISEEIRELFSE
jgi:RNA polymerase sigma factor (sigma-70 family)